MPKARSGVTPALLSLLLILSASSQLQAAETVAAPVSTTTQDARSSKLLKTATRQLAKKQYKAALTGLNKAAAATPKDAEIFYQRALAQYHLSEYKAAVKDLDTALSLGLPQPYRAKLARGKSLHYLADYEGALKDFNAVLEEQPANAEALLCRASAHDSLGQSDLAITDLTKALDLEPVNSQAYLQRALQHKHRGQHQQAKADFEKAVKLDPKLDRWKVAFEEEKDGIVDAISNLGNEIKLKTGKAKATALYNRGMVYSDVGQHRKAIEDFNHAINEDPNSVDLFTQRGTSHFHSCNFEQAKHDFHKAIQLAPNNADLYYRRAVAEFLHGDKSNALTDLDKAISLDPTNDAYYYKRALVHSNQNKYTEAVADLTKAIELKPSDAMYYFNRGVEEALLNQHKQAIEDFSKAIELKPTAVIFKNRALSRMQTEDRTGALEDLQQASTHYLNDGDRFGSAQVTRLQAQLKK